MSKMGKMPISIPSGVVVSVDAFNFVTVKGLKGALVKQINKSVVVCVSDSTEVSLKVNSPCGKHDNMYLGTSRALVNNMIIGVTQGFRKSLRLVGVGYRVTLVGNTLSLVLGFSHVIKYIVPDDVKVSLLSTSEILLDSISKDSLGQVAADIRNYRKPDAYKGKGIRYSDEVIVTKETKKK